jgi:flavin reductase (DIM6/NTAB) family NADH-FMN oxidoreductase RutF
MSALASAARRTARRLLGLPRYGPLGLHDPQEEVQVWLRSRDNCWDVTRNNVIAALRPFTVGVMFHQGQSFQPGTTGLTLSMEKRGDTRRVLGSIQLRVAGSIALDQHVLCLFETPGYENFCASAVGLRAHDYLVRRRAAATQRKNPHNFQMTDTDLRCSFVFYMCPRPVVLVTVEYEGQGNMFPMDLIGPTDSPWFTMALRRTSPAVRLMQQSRCMALTSIPFSCRDVVYRLGTHHSELSIDWSTLPFRTTASKLFGLPVHEEAIRVREVQVKEFHEVGSHVLFVTSIESDTSHERVRDGNAPVQLFHSFSPWIPGQSE